MMGVNTPIGNFTIGGLLLSSKLDSVLNLAFTPTLGLHNVDIGVGVQTFDYVWRCSTHGEWCRGPMGEPVFRDVKSDSTSRSFAWAQEEQRQASIDWHTREIARLRQEPLAAQELLFSKDDLGFPHAAKVAAALDDQLATKHAVRAGRVMCLAFKPRPGGAWKIAAVFEAGEPYGGDEWYVSERKLIEAWESTK